MTHITRVMIPSRDFDATLDFFTKTLRIPLDPHGTPSQDPQFLRVAVLSAPNGVKLEIGEPTPSCAALYLHPVISITVKKLDATRQSLEAQGVEFLSPTVHHEAGRAWTYFRTPSGSPTQLRSELDPEPSPSSPPEPTGTPNAVEWILAPSTRFEESVQFFHEQLGLSLHAQGVPVHDLRFHRYAQFQSEDGVVIEVVEPKAEHLLRFGGPVPSITVADLRTARERLVSEGIELLSDVVSTPDNAGWFYFRVPGSTNFQLSGPWSR